MKNLKYAADVTSAALNPFMVGGLGGHLDLGEAWGRVNQLATNKPKIDKRYDLINKYMNSN
jgi:hypothetical protein